MDWQIAKAIILKNKLINGRISKKILWAIRTNQPLHSDWLSEEVTKEKLENLRKLYSEKVQIYGKSNFPRNSIFYHIIQDKIPAYDWETKDKNVVFSSHTVSNMEISLLSLLLLDIDTERSTLKHRYSCLNSLPKPILDELSELLITIQAIHPDQRAMQQIVNWLMAGLRGETLYTFSLACPDYSVEPTDDPNCPYRHTFNEVGSGIGLIAKRVLEALPAIKKFLDKFGITVKSVLAMADYEVLSEVNLKRLNVSSGEFLHRINSSLQAFKEDSQIPLEVINVSKLCDGLENWQRHYSYFKEKFERKEFGNMLLDDGKLHEMLKARKQLYSQWYGARQNLEDYLPILLAQGAEYAVVNHILAQNYSNCLVLGADHSIFSVFYNIEGSLPMLYLKRRYC